MTTKIEFAVEMTCQKCVNAVQSALAGLDDVSNVDISLEKGTVVVDTNLSYSLIQEKIENSGRRAVLKGYGDNRISAVSMLGGNSGYSVGDEIKGVVRFVESVEGCIVDGTIDGLSPGLHGLHVHECGDISKGCQRHFYGDLIGTQYAGVTLVRNYLQHVGDLGNIEAGDDGRATFRIKDDYLKIPDIIGRSLVITEKPDDLGRGNEPASKIDGNSGDRLACGIIARSSGVFQNTKKICACDGVTLWDERDISLAKQTSTNKQNGK